MLRIGIISDTHGTLDPRAYAALADCEHIIHAGDIGGVAILRELETLAPVTAVLGNNDDSGAVDISRTGLDGAFGGPQAGRRASANRLGGPGTGRPLPDVVFSTPLPSQAGPTAPAASLLPRRRVSLQRVGRTSQRWTWKRRILHLGREPDERC
ncbi:MAG: metallophosphoesterase family protein [Adlercreutzia equolifaciens]